MKNIIQIIISFAFLLVAMFSSGQTCSDGIQNGTETGVDCGGICSPCSTPCQIELTAVSNLPPVQGGCCTYVLEMYDSWGDGWNGASMNVVVNGVIQGPFSATGTGSSQNIAVCNGQTVVLNYLDAGSYPGECSYSLFDGDGNVLFSAGPSPTVANNVFSTTSTCYNPGVLDCNGGPVILTASGQGASVLAIDNDFDFGNAGSGWTTNVNADYNNPCGGSIDGGTYMWMGNSAQHPRIIQTVGLDLSCGGTVCFYLDFATQGELSPCEGIDLAGEGVFLEYSIDGGATWVTLEYYGPEGVGNYTGDGGYNAQMTAWNQYCLQIPVGAETVSTILRWAQTGSSGLDYDHWGLDNVTVSSVADCTPYWYDYDQVSGPDNNPIDNVNVTATTTYTVTYTNGNDECTTTVTVTIPPCVCPEATVTGGGTYCIGDSIPDVIFNVVGGQFPLTLTYAIDGVVQPALVFSSISDTLYNPIEGEYTIISITDPTLCVGLFSGTTQVIGNVAPILVNLSGGGTYCTGDVVNDIVTNVSGTGPFTIDYMLDGIAQTPISGSSPLNLGNIPGVYLLTSLTDAGCTTPISGTETITINPIPLATAGTSTPVICAGSDILLTGNTVIGTYSWTGPDSFTSTTEDPTLIAATIAASGTYTLVISNNGCDSPPSTIEVLVNPIPIVTTNIDQTICLGTSITLFGLGATSYSWDNGVVDGVSFIPGSTNTYTVTGTSNGCAATASVTITILPLPIADGLSSTNYGYQPLVVDFQNLSTYASSYSWNFGNGTTVPMSSTSTVSNTFPLVGTYSVTLTATNGICSDIWYDTIIVIPYPAMVIHVPNVFSPNDDQSNDAYVIDVFNGLSFEATIINRWGNVVHTIDELNDGWDGKINGNLATEGVYFVKYIANGLDGTIQEGHTYFHLIR